MRAICLFLVILFLGSCKINSYILLKDTENTVYAEPPINEQTEYRIAPFDQISFRFYKNSGFEILGGTPDGSANQSSQQLALTNTYNVENDGNIKLPYIGKIKLSGLTLREAEALLETKYNEIFVNPYIIVSVTNRRVIVSSGDGSSKVITLTNNNVSVLEALSLAGGISQRGQTKKVKIFRKVKEGREIYKLDLSTTEGLAYADMPVQANDIIYVEPRKNYAGELVKELAPYLSVISSAVLLLTLSRNIK